MRFGSWRPWQKIAFLNVVCLVGSIMSVFVVPPDTPVWQWAIKVWSLSSRRTS